MLGEPRGGVVPALWSVPSDQRRLFAVSTAVSSSLTCSFISHRRLCVLPLCSATGPWRPSHLSVFSRTNFAESLSSIWLRSLPLRDPVIFVLCDIAFPPPFSRMLALAPFSPFRTYPSVPTPFSSPQMGLASPRGGDSCWPLRHLSFSPQPLPCECKCQVSHPDSSLAAWPAAPPWLSRTDPLISSTIVTPGFLPFLFGLSRISDQTPINPVVLWARPPVSLAGPCCRVCSLLGLSQPTSAAPWWLSLPLVSLPFAIWWIALSWITPRHNSDPLCPLLGNPQWFPPPSEESSESWAEAFPPLAPACLSGWTSLAFFWSNSSTGRPHPPLPNSAPTFLLPSFVLSTLFFSSLPTLLLFF